MQKKDYFLGPSPELFFDQDPTLEEGMSFDDHILFDQGGMKGTSIGSTYMNVHFSQRQARLFFLLLCLVFAIFFTRIAYLQIIQGSEYAALAGGNRERRIPIPAERGLILDRQGVQLVENIPHFALTISPQNLPSKIYQPEERARVIQRLSKLTGVEKDILEERFERYGTYSFDSVVIQENLDYETALSIHIALADLPGIGIQQSRKRSYLRDISLWEKTNNVNWEIASLSHILGYEGKLNQDEFALKREAGYLPSDNIGKTGVEKTYETALRGTYGELRVEVDNRRREQAVLSEQAPIPGAAVRLSMDIQVQAALERALQRALDQGGVQRGAAVAVDPNNGEILGLVSLPGYNNNNFSGGISQTAYSAYIENENRPLFARAIGGTYPSGSVLKTAVAAAALQEGVITPNTSFLSNGGLQVGQWFFPDWLAGGHGQTNVRHSLAWSVNTFYYYIGGGYRDFVGLGVDRLAQYLARFGFAQKLGIDLPAEARGFIPSKTWKKERKNEPWYVGDTYNLSIGQGDFLSTPLQVAMMTAAIANGGTLYQPHVVQSLWYHNADVPEKIQPRFIQDTIIDDQYLQTVRLGMQDCVLFGSCRVLARLPVESAGKTGTAQWNRNKENHAWFTSFAPFDNPEIVVTILVEEGGEGGVVAAPVAADFLSWYFSVYKERLSKG